ECDGGLVDIDLGSKHAPEIAVMSRSASDAEGRRGRAGWHGGSAGGKNGGTARDTLLEESFLIPNSGHVRAALMVDGMVWHRVDESASQACPATTSCHDCGLGQPDASSAPISEIYAVEMLPEASVKSSFFASPIKMHQFAVHTFRRSADRWLPLKLVFCHVSADVCQQWADRILSLLRADPERPRSLLVFVNPIGGRKKGLKTWEAVRPVFDRAGVAVQVVVTSRRNHARDMLQNASDKELCQLDGIIVVGGDGLFNEALNGLARRRHRAFPCTPAGFNTPAGFHSTAGYGYDTPKGYYATPKAGAYYETPKPGSGGSEGYYFPTPKEGGDRAKGFYETPKAQQARCSFGRSSFGPGVRNATFLSDWGTVREGEEEEEEEGGEGEERGGMGEWGKGVEEWEEGGVGEDGGVELCLPRRLRIGIIPAGSTDCIAMSLVGSRDPATTPSKGGVGEERRGMHGATGGAAEGSRKEDGEQQMECDVRYAASFFGYGFYGAVTKESETLRWMGPARYDYAGFMTYMRHRSYEAEVSFFHIPEPDQPSVHRRSTTTRPEICTVGCSVCANGQDLSLLARSALGFEAIGPSQSAVGLASLLTPLNRTPGDSAAADLAHAEAAAADAAAAVSPSYQPPPAAPDASAATATEADKHNLPSPPPLETAGADVAAPDSPQPPMWDEATPGWRTVRGRFHSVGGAVISCRNDKAPDGVAAHAHLADGNLNLIMIRECSRAEYLQQLLCLAIKGADPLNFHFVQHHKTPAFTFKAMGEQGFWNVDGELVEASELSAQVFRGMVDMFGSGPDV
ncbi:unnamed protein product, partial [Closterium sp. Yama58-4]